MKFNHVFIYLPYFSSMNFKKIEVLLWSAILIPTCNIYGNKQSVFLMKYNFAVLDI